MRAIQINEWGGPEVLQVVDLDVPEPADDQVLIRVTRAGINCADTHQTENSYLAKFELPLIPGGEVAGVVERDGGGFEAGQRVVAMAGTGGYAEYVAAPAAQTFAIPDGVDDELALALLIQGLTAWHLYRTCARVQQGESVVVDLGRGRRRVAGRAARQAHGRGPRDRDGVVAREARADARAGRRRGGRPGHRGPDRRDRRGQRGQAASTPSSRWRAASIFDGVAARAGAVRPDGHLRHRRHASRTRSRPAC